MNAPFFFGIPFDDFLAFAAAAAAFLVLLAIWHGLVVRDPFTARVRALEGRRDALRANLRVNRGHGTRSDLRESGIGLARRIVMRFNLIRGQHSERIALKLARAGKRSKDAVIVYLFCKLAMPFVLGGYAMLMLNLMDKDSLNPGIRALILCGGFIVGLYATDIYLSNATKKRVIKMRKGLPDALDLLVICAEAGLSLDAALTRVGREMANACPELSDEFSLASLELGFLPDRQKALNNLVERTTMAEIRSIVNSLMQTERYGTPLAQSLRVLSAEFRDDRIMRAEEKAAKLPATMTVPMILFILPSLFMVLGGPAAIQTIDTLSKL
ncbi:MAG TPA: type II secretion system F family protein [Alphaproteobacteria bacterium]|nr:type II secretion system F family protein [Alphaproteobacteria bacterium]